MTAKKAVNVEVKIGFNVKNMFVKHVTKSGNAGHVMIPKRLIKSRVVVIVPERQIDIKLIEASNKPSKISFGINPELICSKCGKPWGRPAGKRFEDIETCDCK